MSSKTWPKNLIPEQSELFLSPNPQLNEMNKIEDYQLKHT
jgi:hypothetical protein